MKLIDSFLNKITMYRLVLYVVSVLWVAGLVASALHLLPFSPLNLAFSLILITLASWATNWLFANAFGALRNVESDYITALILALILDPASPTSISGIGFLVAVSALAMASKYLLTYRKKHLFNPAAFGAAIGALLLPYGGASWWVGGNVYLLPLVLVGGFLIVRKIHRFDLVLTFLAIAGLTAVLTATGSSPVTALLQTVLHSPIFFLASVMLTEPLTTPPSRSLRMLYAALVGVLFAPHVHVGSYYFTPEMALLAGNVFVFIVSPRGRAMLTLRETNEIARDTHELVFTSDRPLPYAPGQYIEWTLPPSGADDRGNRRLFTIASSPTESVIRLGVKKYAPPSTFKEHLFSLVPGDTITAAQIAGDFILPRDPSKKLVFIAGGIGITPFRSMLHYLIDHREKRDITLLYSNKTAAEIAYRDIFELAREIVGLKTVYVLTDEPAPVVGAHQGLIDEALISREVPDYKERVFYISGPQGMVDAFKARLRKMGVSPLNIRSDYFPGF